LQSAATGTAKSSASASTDGIRRGLAADAGLTATSKAGEIGAWLKTEHNLGHSHAMTLAQIIRNLDAVDLANPTPAGPPPGSIGRLWRDGAATQPTP